MSSHKVTAEYHKRVEQFEHAFSSGYAFLKRIEHESGGSNLWLSTAVNAHLYKADAFLAYLKLKNPELKPPSLVASPRFNHQIAAHTLDQSGLLFPVAFDEVVARHAGTRAGWAVRHANGNTELTASTPAAFFESLFDLLVRLEAPARP